MERRTEGAEGQEEGKSSGRGTIRKGRERKLKKKGKGKGNFIKAREDCTSWKGILHMYIGEGRSRKGLVLNRERLYEQKENEREDCTNQRA